MERHTLGRIRHQLPLIMSAALKKKKACEIFTTSKQPERERLSRPLTPSILEVLEACGTLNGAAHLYNSLPNCGIKQIPWGCVRFLKTDQQGKCTKNKIK